ncbi:MAG: hypothetical protein AAB434_05160 [Planctomycetota bacterium]
MKRTLVTASGRASMLVAGLGLSSFLWLGTGCSSAPPPRAHGGHHGGGHVVHAPAPPHDEAEALRDDLDALQHELAAAQGRPAAGGGPVAAGPADEKAVAGQLYEAGREAFQANDYERAKDILAKAVAADPANAEAKRLLEDARLMTGEYTEEDKGARANREIKASEAKVRAQIAEIETRYNRGVRAMNMKDFDKAVEEFSFVTEAVKWFPYNVDLTTIKKQSAKLLEEAKAMAEIAHAELARDQERMTQRNAEMEERARFEQRAKKILQLFQQAQDHLEAGHYELAERLCDDILVLDPNSFKTEDLKSICRSAKHDDESRHNAVRQLDEMRRWQESVNAKMLSQTDTITFTDRESWDKINRRQPRGFGGSADEMSDVDREVKAKMRDTKISLNFTDAPLPDVVTFLREYTRLNILIDEASIEAPADKKITFRVDELAFEQAFDLILKMLDLAYKIEQGTIIITTREKIAMDTRLELYDVQDLVVSLIDFPGPNISLAPPAEGEEGGGGATIEEQASSKPFTGEDLKELIKNNVAKGTWDTAPNSIEFSNGLLITRHTPDTHRAIQKLLNDVRQSTGMVVTIESRFLTVSTHFLENVGVDWRGLDVFPSEDLFSTTPERQFSRDRDINNDGTADVISSGFVGPFGSDQEVDIRGRIEHSLGQDRLINNFWQTVLSNAGGASMTYAIVDDITAEAIIRAVHKDERSKVLTAPKVTVYNTQRANVFVARQIAYVKDYDIEIAQQAVIADPIPATLQDGITLDVRPTVSADRRYVTIELRPTVARLQRDIEDSFIDVDVTGGNGAGILVRIETPDMQIERARTTVTIPDGGTILVGGLTDIFDDQSESNVPFLKDIPILNFFFSQKQEAQQRRSLLVLVRAKITIAEEEERNVR